MTLSPLLSSTTVLGKRKAGTLVLRLTSSPEPSTAYSESETDTDHSKTPKSRLPILVNGSLVAPTRRRYKCLYSGCDKAYTKPSRLEEHTRSHTGLRPYVCGTCNKSYLRETHLQAHARSHLPISDRPFQCQKSECRKRFCTAQHLKRHEDMHGGVKPFSCTEPGCEEAFAKHHQLRAHVVKTHAPPATKPYGCAHRGCSKSFSTNQKLRAHSKTHNEKRYTCVHPSCMFAPSTPAIMAPVYYPTWTALQLHIRTAHPPTCSNHAEPRVFAMQKGLKAHMKVCEGDADEAEGDDAAGRTRKRRKRGESDGDWICVIETCEKSFSSKKALATHTSVTHLGLRPYACPHSECEGLAFGYKHLLGRHLQRMHSDSANEDGDDEEDEGETSSVEDNRKDHAALDIDTITGKAYASHAQLQLHQSRKTLRCPHPAVDFFLPSSANISIIHSTPASAPSASSSSRLSQAGCAYVFTRAYDLRRHLRSEHGIEVEKEVVEEWVVTARREKIQSGKNED